MREKIYEFIKAFAASNGYPPTLTEIGREFGIVKSDVAYHLDRLRGEGRIDWHSGKARTIRVLEA